MHIRFWAIIICPTFAILFFFPLHSSIYSYTRDCVMCGLCVKHVKRLVCVRYMRGEVIFLLFCFKLYKNRSIALSVKLQTSQLHMCAHLLVNTIWSWVIMLYRCLTLLTNSLLFYFLTTVTVVVFH